MCVGLGLLLVRPLDLRARAHAGVQRSVARSGVILIARLSRIPCRSVSPVGLQSMCFGSACFLYTYFRTCLHCWLALHGGEGSLALAAAPPRSLARRIGSTLHGSRARCTRNEARAQCTCWSLPARHYPSRGPTAKGVGAAPLPRALTGARPPRPPPACS